VRISYDAEVDAAYISFFKKGHCCGPVETVPVAASGGRGDINLDFDDADHLLGIEILDASRYLPSELLRPLD
jgi:uncharacterized protein YuzE